MTGNGKEKKQVRFARAGDDEAGEEEEDTLCEKRPARLRAEVLEDEGARSRAEDEVHLVFGGQQCRGIRCCITTVICAAFLGLGMAISVLGPTFPDLAANVDSTVGNISYIFVGRSMGYLGGSVLGGVLFDRMNQHLLLGLSMMATCIGLLVLPWCKKAILLTGAMSVVGISMGFLDTGGNVVILNTWGDEAGPHVQALHFSFAVGALLAPILAKLIPEILPFDKNHTTSQEVLNMPLEIKKSMLSYIVIATYILLVSIFLFILYCKSPSNQSAAKGLEERRTAKYHNALIFLLSLFFFFYVGAEVAYGSYIFTYAITMAEMDHDKAAGLNSIFWGVFAMVRGFAICFATCLYPGTMLLLSVVGCTVSSVCLMIFYKKHIVLWIGSALYGASMATTFPSGFSWAQQYTTIGSKSASLFVVGAALGEMAIPASVGYLQGMLPDLPVLMYTILASSAVTAVLFPVMYKLATSSQDKVRWGAVESEDRRALLSSSGLEEEEEEEDAQQLNDADFEAIDMNDRSKNSITVITEDASEVTSTSNSNSQTISKNGTLGDQVVDRSPLINHLRTGHCIYTSSL